VPLAIHCRDTAIAYEFLAVFVFPALKMDLTNDPASAYGGSDGAHTTVNPIYTVPITSGFADHGACTHKRPASGWHFGSPIPFLVTHLSH
jgi:hypothetical protein